MTRPIVVYGAGGHGREIAALIGDLRSAGADWDFRGFLSDDRATWGSRVGGVPVLGDGEWVTRLPGVAVAVAVGDSAARCRVVAGLEGRGVEYPSLVHPAALVMERSSLGPGVIAGAGAIVTVDVEVGEFAVLNIQSSVSHDCRIAPYATLGPRVVLPGGVTVGTGADLGAGAGAIPRVSIGEWSIVGAGAVIVRNLPANCTAAGVPARVLSARSPGWHLVIPPE